MMKLNEKQLLAVNTIDKNVLLDASAGTGKTTVLVNRFVNILEKGDFRDIKESDHLSSIVAITFTKKASNELKERISKLIYEKAKTSERFKNYYKMMPSANVSTVHQFAFKILKRFPLLANIDPRAKVVEEDEADAFLDRALRETLNEKNYEELFKALDKNYDDSFVFSIKNFINKTRAMDMDLVQSKTYEYIKNFYDEEKIKSAAKNIYANIFKAKDQAKGKAKILKQIEKYEKSLDELKNLDLENINFNLFNDFAYDIGTNAKLSEVYNEITEDAKFILMAMEIKKLSYYDEFFDLIKLSLKKYKIFKDEQAALDFNDLEIIFRDLLKLEEVRESLKHLLSYIMVDEFQDTSPVQKEIYYQLNDILGKDRLFVVGDFKQSIYAFRGADISLYRSVKDDFISDEKSTTISMNENYRTGEKIISSVNKLFKKEIDGYEDLIYKGDIVDSEVKLINYSEKNDRELEARAIANKIIALYKEGVSFKDIVILLRSNKDSKEIEKALKNAKLPVYNAANKALNSRDEMENIYNFLHYLKYEDELSLIAILRSDFYSLSDDEIFYIKDKDDFKYYKEELQKYILLKDEERLDEVLKIFFADKNFIEKNLFRKRSAQRYANIRLFLNKINEYYESGRADFNYIVDDLLSGKENYAKEASYINENDDIIKIMTIHKAKGLEAKIIICAQMDFRKAADFSFIAIDEDKIFLKFKDISANYKNIKAKDSELDDEEKLRNLYVMLTRAQEKLIIFHSNANIGFNPYLLNLDGESEEANFDEQIFDEDKKVYEDINCATLISKNVRSEKNLYAPLPSGSSYAYDFAQNAYKIYDDERDFLEETFEKKKLGSAVHRFCEAYEGQNFEDVFEKTMQIFDLDKKYYDVVLTCAKNYAKYFNEISSVKSYKEFEYYYTKDDIIYTGVIDRINIYDDFVEIIDYKVSSLSEDEIKKIYTQQLRMYKEAVKTMFKKDAKAKIFLLRKNKFIDME